MPVKPKSNKMKRLERKRKLAERAARVNLRQERAAFRQKERKAQKALRAWKAVRQNPDALIGMAAAGQKVQVPQSSDLYAIVTLFEELSGSDLRSFAKRPDLGALEQLIVHCRRRARFLTGRDAAAYLTAMVALSAYRQQWIRAPEEWVPRSHSAYKQFHSLVRHLVARYEVPTFMNTAWLEGLDSAGVVHQNWFMHVAKGQNIRTAEGLPVPLTKKQAHWYLQTPDDFDVRTAFRWAQIRDMGGDERLVRSLCATWVANNFADEAFWLTVFRWLVEHPMLDRVHHGPIIDYLHDQRFVSAVPNPRAHLAGQPRLIPVQPNLTMKGRTPEALLRAVRQWHRALGRQETQESFAWDPSGFAPLVHEEGSAEAPRVFTTTELLNTRDLNEEGRAMKHCVGTYASSCASGNTSIWSLQVAEPWGQKARLLTLEVCRVTRQIVQARRKQNRMPSPKEIFILQRWASAEGLSLSKWLTE